MKKMGAWIFGPDIFSFFLDIAQDDTLTIYNYKHIAYDSLKLAVDCIRDCGKVHPSGLSQKYSDPDSNIMMDFFMPYGYWHV